MRYLVVANETLLGELLEEVRWRCQKDKEAVIDLVVPATHGRGAWTEGGVRSAAHHRLEEALPV